jgi:hypothetical protein
VLGFLVGAIVIVVNLATIERRVFVRSESDRIPYVTHNGLLHFVAGAGSLLPTLLILGGYGLLLVVRANWVWWRLIAGFAVASFAVTAFALPAWLPMAS